MGQGRRNENARADLKAQSAPARGSSPLQILPSLEKCFGHNLKVLNIV